MNFSEKCERAAWLLYVSAGPVLYAKYINSEVWISAIMASMWAIGAWNIWKELTE